MYPRSLSTGGQAMTKPISVSISEENFDEVLGVLRELVFARERYNYVRDLYMCPYSTLDKTERRLDAANISARRILEIYKDRLLGAKP